MDNNEILKSIADRNNSPDIGLTFTITDQGETSFSLVLKGHSIPIEDSDAHSLTLAMLAQKYLPAEF